MKNRRQKIFNKGWLYVCAVGLDIRNVAKILLIHSVPCFNLGDLEVCLGELSPPKASHGDGTDSMNWLHETFLKLVK